MAADGNSTRLSLAMGLRKRDDRPMGVAVRTYYTSPRTDDDWLESWLELWDGDRLLPGYGWIFGVGDGTVNVGPRHPQLLDRVRQRRLPRTSCGAGSTPRRRSGGSGRPTAPSRSVAPRCPWGSTGRPHYTRGLLLVGDAGGMVNPFNGEGIAYAMESGAMAAETIVQAHRRSPPRRLASGRSRPIPRP